MSGPNGVSNNYSQVDLTAFLQKLTNDSIDDNVSVTLQRAEGGGANLTVTRNAGKDDATVIGSRSIPELDDAELAKDFPILASLMSLNEKMTPESIKEIEIVFGKYCKEVVDDMQSGKTALPTVDHSQALFNIYDMMNLLHDAAQTMKKTAREARECALQSQMAMIRTEADIQEHAAKVALITTVVISVTMFAFTVGFSGGALKCAANQTKSGSLQMFAQSFMMLGNAIGQIGQSLQQIESAQATRIQADEKKAEALHEEMSDIMQDVQEVISAVRELRQAINESEGQSIDTILRA